MRAVAAAPASRVPHEVSQVYSLCLDVQWVWLGDPGRNWQLHAEITQLTAVRWDIKKWQSP